MMTATRPKTTACGHCGNKTVHRNEKDEVGLTLTCTTCGSCVYLDKYGNEINQLDESDQTPEEDLQTKTDALAYNEQVESEPDQKSPGVTRNGPEMNLQPFPNQERNLQGNDEEILGESDQTHMLKIPCPFCQFHHVPEESQPLEPRARCADCGKWFMTRTATPEQPYTIQEKMRATLHLFHTGMRISQVIHAIAEMTGTPREKPETISRWIRDKTEAAIHRTSKCEPECSDEWILTRKSFTARRLTQYSWILIDPKTQYILSVEITNTSALSRSFTERAIRTAGKHPLRIRIDVNLHQKIKSEFAQQFPNANHVTKEGFTENTERAHLAIAERFKIMTSGRNNLETLNRYAQGIVFVLNFLERPEGTSSTTPARRANVIPIFDSWKEIITWTHYTKRIHERSNPSPRAMARSETKSSLNREEMKGDIKSEKGQSEIEEKTNPAPAETREEAGQNPSQDASEREHDQHETENEALPEEEDDTSTEGPR